MKYGTATPERNSGQKLTIPVKTRTPLEAYKMLLAGQPIDQIGQMYHIQGVLDKDFFMMDKTEKLRKLSELRTQRDQSKTDIEYYSQLYNESLKAQQNESSTQEGSGRNV